VQIVWSWRKGSRSIEHLGSAHDDGELAALKTPRPNGWPPGRPSWIWGSPADAIAAARRRLPMMELDGDGRGRRTRR
jgi:hypothetical protein